MSLCVHDPKLVLDLRKSASVSVVDVDGSDAAAVIQRGSKDGSLESRGALDVAAEGAVARLVLKRTDSRKDGKNRNQYHRRLESSISYRHSIADLGPRPSRSRIVCWAEFASETLAVPVQPHPFPFAPPPVALQ